MGAGEIWITPSKGMSSSRIRKIAPATESAASITATMTVAFGGANRTALMNMIASQEMRIISIGRDMDVSVCSNSSQHLTEIGSDLHGLRLESALHVVLWRKVLD